MSTDDQDQRPERAFRTAMRLDEPAHEPAPSLEPGGVRRRLRRQRAVTGVVAAAAVLIVGAVVLPRALTAVAPAPLVGAPPTTSSGEPSVAVAPGWRLEQYRFVTAQVPKTWAYAQAPGSDWCADSPDGKPIKARLKPYVSLGQPAAVRSIGCPAPPSSLLTEHAEFSVVPEGSTASIPASTENDDGWWIFTRILTADGTRVMVKVVSKDRELADQIAGSAAVGGGKCAPTSAVQKFGSRAPRADLTDLTFTDEVVLCQYDPDPQDGTAGQPAGGLSAVRTVTGASGQTLAEAIATATRSPEEAPTGCSTNRVPQIDLAITAEIVTGSQRRTVYLTHGTCIDPADANTTFGGVDDGVAVRPLDRDLCLGVVQPPVDVVVWSRGSAPCGG